MRGLFNVFFHWTVAYMSLFVQKFEGPKHSRGLAVFNVVDAAGLAQALMLEEHDIKKAVKSEQLRLGRHFFVLNGKERFQLSNSLVDKLLEDGAAIAATVDRTSRSGGTANVVGNAIATPRRRNRAGKGGNQ